MHPRSPIAHRGRRALPSLLLRTLASRRAGRSVIAGLVVHGALCGAALGIDVAGVTTAGDLATHAHVSGCTEIPQGSFAGGLEGWTSTPTVAMSGDAFGVATSQIIDGDGPFDPHVLAVLTTSVAGYPSGGIGQATHKVTISTSATVTNDLLCVQLGGGFEYLYFGNAALDTLVRIDVVGPGGEVATLVVREFHKPGGPGCLPAGLSVFGVYGFGDISECVDLKAAGFAEGDVADIIVSCEVGAATTEECQVAVAESVFLVDHFRFCREVPHPADFDGDGCVGQSDLGILLTDFGCKEQDYCVCDLDASGSTDQVDLGIFLASFGSGC